MEPVQREPARPVTSPGPDSLAGLRHRWWLVALLTGLGLVAAAGWLQTRPLEWEATSAVLVHPAGQDTNVVGGRTQGEVNLDTEAQLVRSTAVTAGAAERLGLDPPSHPDLAERVRVAVPPNSSVLAITFAAPTPERAQAGAQAFAEVYLHHRGQSARAAQAAQVAAIEETLAELEQQLSQLTEQLAVTPPDTGAAATLDTQLGTVVSQVNALTGRRNELATATVSPGTVISEARLPAEPSRPQPALVLASGAALGLVAGAGSAGLAEQLARRVRRPADLPRRLGVPVLASLPPASTRLRDEIASPYGPAGRTVDRLRNEVLAALSDPPADPARARVIVVTSPTGAPAAGPVAANLAASLARCGHDAILLEATGAGAAGPLPRLLAVAPAPGLSELLAGRASVAEALQRPPRYPRLRAMTMGGTATATGLLQSPALRTVLAALAAQAGYLIVAAPATATSADAQSLASHADLTVLAVEARRTRLAEVADAAAQLHRVGTPLLGAVVLPRQPPERARPGHAGHPGQLSRPSRLSRLSRLGRWSRLLARLAKPRRSGGPRPAGAARREGYEGTGRDGSAGSNGRPVSARPRGAEAPAPRQSEDRLPPATIDGQTLVLARLVDRPAAPEPPSPPDLPAPLEPAAPPDLPAPPDHPAEVAAGAEPPTEPR